MYLRAVILAGAAGVVALLAQTGGRSGRSLVGDDPFVTAVLIAGIVATELRPIPWLEQRGTRVTLSWVCSFALVLIGAPLGAVIAVAVTSIAADLLDRRPLHRALFNGAQLGLSLGAGAAILAVAGHADTLVDPEAIPASWLPVVLLAAAAMFSLNSLFIAIAVAMATGGRVTTVLRGLVPSTVTSDVLLLSLAPIFVVVAQRSLWLLLLLGLTVVAIYISARLATTRAHDADHDPLTGLPNRRAFRAHAHRELDQASPQRDHFGILLVDLDGFKAVNDSLGHAAGDRALIAVADRIGATLGPRDLAARLGGDEFALLIAEPSGHDEVAARAEALRRAIDEPIPTDAGEAVVGASIGIACYPDDADGLAALLQHADDQMYAEKRSRGRAHAAADDAQTERRDAIAAAADAGELTVRYEPRVCLATGSVLGAALRLEWARGDQPSIDHVELYETAGETTAFGRVTDELLSVALDLVESVGIDDRLTMIVPVSAYDLADLAFPDRVAAALDRAGATPDRLQCMIDQATLGGGGDLTASVVVSGLRGLGVSVGIDRFGETGVDLTTMRRFEIDDLGLHPSFTAGFGTRPRDEAIAGALTAACRQLGVTTTARGVTDLDTWRALAGVGFDRADGPLVAAPMPLGELVDWLHATSFRTPRHRIGTS